MSTEDIKQFLGSLGYEILVRVDGWTECLVTGPDERWLGRGSDEGGALRDVERQMFPSHAARSLLLQIRPAVPTADTAPENVVVEEPECVEDLAPEATTHEAVILENEKTATSVVFSMPAPEPEPAMSGTYVYPDDDPAPPKIEEPEEPDVTKEEALEIVAGINDEITDGLDDVAVMSTLHQRLHIAAWIFRARAVQERFPRDDEVEEAVHQIAVRLTGLCKVYWPGSVRALQVYTTPMQALEGLLRTPKTPLKWAESAEIMEAHIEQVEGDKSRDEFGWRDRAQCNPAPPNPEAVLAEAVAKIEAVVGSVGEPLDDKRRKVASDHILSELETLVMAAHLMRWARRSMQDPQLWGKAMGALRWASRQPRDRGAVHALQDVIADEHRPSRPWAELLGRDPRVNEKNRLRKQVMDNAPQPEWLEEDLMAWLHKAFQAFSNPQIAKLAAAVREQVMGLTNADFADADRNTRSRLRKLQAIFRVQQDVTSVELPDVSDVAEDEMVEAASKRVDPAQVLLSRVQEITRGRHVLFVTNRDDQRLRQDLERDLECDVTLKDGGNPRTMKAVLKSVDGDKYDFVLMATGFNNHSADASLCRAAKLEGIPYVRVQKGRLASTIRALGRAFNVSSERKAADETPVAHAG